MILTDGRKGIEEFKISYLKNGLWIWKDLSLDIHINKFFKTRYKNENERIFSWTPAGGDVSGELGSSERKFPRSSLSKRCSSHSSLNPRELSKRWRISLSKGLKSTADTGNYPLTVI